MPPDADTEDSSRSVEAMAASYIEELLAMQFGEPFFLGGYSFGGIVAFEMAQQLTAKGYRVGLLAILDESFPDYGWEKGDCPQGERRARSAERKRWALRASRFALPALCGGFLQNLPFWLWDEFFPRTPRQHYARILKMARRLKQRTAALFGHAQRTSLQEDVSELFTVSRLSEGFRAICEANYRALKSYQAKSYAGKLTLFRGRTQPLFARHRPDLGWGKIASGGLALKVIPGTHGSILKEPHVKVLAEEFEAALNGA
jgi:thioesterase domain-containing protein